jgi:hypothetical protein
MYKCIALYSDGRIINKKQSSNTEMNLRTLLRSSHPISELGNVIGKFATNLGTMRCNNQRRLIKEMHTIEVTC